MNSKLLSELIYKLNKESTLKSGTSDKQFLPYAHHEDGYESRVMFMGVVIWSSKSMFLTRVADMEDVLRTESLRVIKQVSKLLPPHMEQLTVAELRKKVREAYPHVIISVFTVSIPCTSWPSRKVLKIYHAKSHQELTVINAWAGQADVRPDERIHVYPR